MGGSGTRRAPAASPFPTSRCDTEGCTAWAQRQWAEPDGKRRCIGHSLSPEALSIQHRAGQVLVSDGDEDEEDAALSARAALTGAPRLLERSAKDFRELLSTEDGREYLRAWIFQGVVLKGIDADRASVGERIIKAASEAAPKSDKDGWRSSPLGAALGDLDDEDPKMPMQ